MFKKSFHDFLLKYFDHFNKHIVYIALGPTRLATGATKLNHEPKKGPTQVGKLLYGSLTEEKHVINRE